MDIVEFLSNLIKVVFATAIYFAVLGLGVFSAWWMSRRARRRGERND